MMQVVDEDGTCAYAHLDCHARTFWSDFRSFVFFVNISHDLRSCLCTCSASRILESIKSQTSAHSFSSGVAVGSDNLVA